MASREAPHVQQEQHGLQEAAGGSPSPDIAAPAKLCIKNCGFYGTPQNNNLCSRCFTQLNSADGNLKQKVEAPSPAPHSTSVTEINGAPSTISSCSSSSCSSTCPPQKSSRCFSCKKRVGLLGFKCRCGDVFCSAHRYSEQHNCSFDYKAIAHAAIAAQNPVVTADKVAKI